MPYGAYDDPSIFKRAMLFIVIGISLSVAGIIVISVAIDFFYIAGCMIFGGVVMIGIGAVAAHRYQTNKNRVQTIAHKEATQGTTTQRIEYGQGAHLPAYSGPPAPAGGWQNDPYPQSYQPGPPLPGTPSLPAYGQPTAPPYGQMEYGQTDQPAYGQPSYGQSPPPTYGQAVSDPYQPYTGPPPP
ncbi:uncharacterized protein LOC100369501 [Saccoglossus kowalevskii]|uniref:Heterogeneous nuclear ribonucleoprotein U-like protein 1-like n=1 Tax=Saccoglossus kowalevskii TaxID=10224 RepID=A0ABM0GJZ6_SACKO|nr:PREDICTED: heterogeneous nuclear ribonucleoprotein U-like protein 1-like [Saccoglossus kowalevskii]